MNELALDIDNGMYAIYVSDADNHISVLTSILANISSNEATDDMINEAVSAAKSLSSGAKLSKIPRIPEVADNIAQALTMLVSKKINSDTSLHDTLSQAIDLIGDLNKTSANDIPPWLTVNDADLSQVLEDLNLLSSKENIENASASAVKAKEDNKAKSARKVSNIDMSMLELFMVEAEAQAKSIDENLLALEIEPDNNALIEPLMRASHSIKGAARMIGFEEIVAVSHRMEDCFVYTQKGKLDLDKQAIDLLLYCNDILKTVSIMAKEQLSTWLQLNQSAFDACLIMLEALANNSDYDVSTLPALVTTDQNTTNDTDDQQPSCPTPKTSQAQTDNTVRIQSEHLNKMLAVSNELLVSQNWIQEHHDSLQILKKRQTELATSTTKLRHVLEQLDLPEEVFAALLETENRIDTCRQSLHQDISKVDDYDRKTYVLSSRLNQQVIASRMRHFSEGTHGFKRMVRDVSQSLNKEIKLDIEGLDTLVDSDILDKIEAPLTHLIRNAIDHGIEDPSTRLQKGKSKHGHITVSAFHKSGLLNISVSDDGKGVDLNALKEKIINKGMVNQKMAERLSDSELLEFLFLPGFSTRDNVTEYSGRGVGLDVVHSVVTTMRGQLRSSTKVDQGLKVQLQLPLTLSVLHSLLTDIGNEYYAFPLTRIHAVIKKQPSDIFTLENKQLVKYEGHDVSLINGREILETRHSDPSDNDIVDIVILNERNDYYGIVVDSIVGKANLALHPIDPRLGKIKDISAAAIADDSKPVLVIDVDDLLINIQERIGINNLGTIERHVSQKSEQKLKKILVIDDSLTVREVEKNLLESRGYSVDIAVDGIDGWNSVKQQDYDLVITDIDMPRMNGIELVSQLKMDKRLSSIPVMIVSYKDNPDDRKKGLDAGADYYLTKGSFHDEGLITGVIDLIGEPGE